MTIARTSEDRDRVKSATDIVRLVGEHVSLRQKGREFAGLCPFHDDHNPSMYVVPGKQIYHCFVCGAGGDVFDFVMGYHRMEFREALEYLADRAGVTLTPGGRAGGEPAAPRSGVGRKELLGACGAAQGFFRAMLRREDIGGPAREALRARGVSDEMIERFGLGASPDRIDGLASVVRAKGLELAPFVESGLLYDNRGPATDVFRGRIMFPIRDQLGRAIAFGARLIGTGEPKYLNSQETRIFHKSEVLYGLSEASDAIRSMRIAVVTEGYTDVIACHQAGLENVVGVLGTALTDSHARALRRLCDRVVLLFDGDDAGLRAADRAVEVFFREPVDVSVATLSAVSDAKDPDELLRRPGGVAMLQEAIAAARDLLGFRMDRLRLRLAGAGPAALASAVEQEIQRLGELGLRDASPVRRRMIARQLATLAGVDEGVVLRAIPAGRRGSEPGPARPSVTGDAPRALGLLLAHPGLAETIAPEQLGLLATETMSGSLREVALALTQCVADGESTALEHVLGALTGGARAEAVGLWRAVTGSDLADPEKAAVEWDQVRRQLALAAGARDARSTSAPLAERLQAMRRLRRDFGADRRRSPGVPTYTERGDAGQ